MIFQFGHGYGLNYTAFAASLTSLRTSPSCITLIISKLQPFSIGFDDDADVHRRLSSCLYFNANVSPSDCGRDEKSCVYIRVFMNNFFITFKYLNV